LALRPPEYGGGIINGYTVVYNPRTQVIIDIAAVCGR
jgi:hypothetical protein